MSARGSITLGELQGKLTMLDVACHRCERRGRVSLPRLIEEHGADMGLPDLWESLAYDCPNAHTTALHSRCAIYYPQSRCFCRPRKPDSVDAAVAVYRWRTRPLPDAFPGSKSARQPTRISADQN